MFSCCRGNVLRPITFSVFCSLLNLPDQGAALSLLLTWEAAVRAEVSGSAAPMEFLSYVASNPTNKRAAEDLPTDPQFIAKPGRGKSKRLVATNPFPRECAVLWSFSCLRFNPSSSVCIPLFLGCACVLLSLLKCLSLPQIALTSRAKREEMWPV